ncbi:MAG: DNA mismatch repair protein MutS [Crocinitomicaceae bacterium]|nr:DNA mismatch repair protein MutS [Crocinitomicaceae bacterium]
MSPLEFYTSQKEKFQEQRSSVIHQQRLFRMVRLTVFLLIAGTVYFFWGDWGLIALTVFLGSILFTFLVFRSSDLSGKRKYLESLIAINETEIEVLGGRWHHLDEGDDFKQDDHDFSQDLDLFGRASFFQYLNRTVLKRGRDKVAQRLASNHCENIEQKQEAIKELGQKVEWRQDFSAHGSLIKSKISEASIISWFAEYKTFTDRFSPLIVIVISLISLVAIALYSFSLIPGTYLLGWFFVGGGIIARYLKNIGQLVNHTGQIQETFERYHVLLDRIESEEFKSEQLANWQSKIHQKDKNASQIFKEFSKLLNALDQRNNIIVSIPANGFFLRDLWISYKIEKWISQNASKVEEWFTVVSDFDALNSFGNYAYNQRAYVYPELIGEGKQVEATQLGHPLLKSDGRVDNDFTMSNKEFFIVTGANMAGKSTFLRTVGLSIVLANNGLPVCAKSFAYSPMKLISSMRTTDSLSDNESYFFSELKRLKYIIDTIETEEHFIILDEILKGTNSKDKAKGSQQFVEKLVRTGSTGIIATHDLSLCELEAQLDQVKNYYFDAEIVNDELYFDYRLKLGVCQNMNASFLLKKMGIV